MLSFTIGLEQSRDDCDLFDEKQSRQLTNKSDVKLDFATFSFDIMIIITS